MTSQIQPIPQHPNSQTTVFLDQPPSCLQFCPQAPDYAVIGTYLLSETKDQNEHGDDIVRQRKTGSLQLWKLNPVNRELSLIQRIPLEYAVFDLNFHPSNPSILAIATSTGCIAVFQITIPKTTGSTAPSIAHLWTRSVHEDPSIPALFLSWAPSDWLEGEDAEKDGALAVTFSDGRTSLFASSSFSTDYGDAEKVDGNISKLGMYNARELIEVWFVALASFTESKDSEYNIPFMFTGDDFGTLYTRRFDAVKRRKDQSTFIGNDTTNSHEEKEKEEEEEDNQLQPLHDSSDRSRHHTAGVTAILPLPISLEDSGNAPLLLTGSYDEYLRVYHATRPGAVLDEMSLGGGVWRLQLLSVDRGGGSEDVGGRCVWEFLVLASCMHAGSRVVRIRWFEGTRDGDGLGEWEINVIAQFTEHESMNYASDVWKGGQAGGNRESLLCISSSFYDRRVCVWEVGL